MHARREKKRNATKDFMVKEVSGADHDVVRRGMCMRACVCEDARVTWAGKRPPIAISPWYVVYDEWEKMKNIAQNSGMCCCGVMGKVDGIQCLVGIMREDNDVCGRGRSTSSVKGW